MKKVLSLTMAIILLAVLVAGCTKKDGDDKNKTSQPVADETVKTGLAVINSIAKSTNVKDGKGLAEMDSTAVAVTVDKNGKIVKCVIDGLQVKANFSDAGKITTPLDTEFKSKNELGETYGMKKASKISKEWNEQAAAFAKYVEGKTVSEIEGISLNEEKAPTGTDLTASVTISVGGFIEAVKKAVSNAADMGAKKDDKLGLGISTDIKKSKDAGDKDGLAQSYAYFTVTTTDKSGKITSCILDAAQVNVNFDKTGKITSDLTAAPKTKNELKEEYGMKKASKISKEWYEEAAAFASYVKGKTVDEVEGIAVDEATHPTGTDLTASVTITVGSFKNTIKKASASAK